MDPWDFGDKGKFTTLQSEEMNICNIAIKGRSNPVLMLASVLVVISSQLTKLRRKSLEWSVRGFLSGAKRKSHGLLAEARPPLCDGPENACTFGKRTHTQVFFGQFVVTQILSAKWEVHLQELQGWT